MLDISYADFRLWKGTKKLARLRDATNKLVAVAENLTSNKANMPIENWGQFRHIFLKEFKDQELLIKLYDLHRFFYQGLGYEGDVRNIEYNYTKGRKALRTMVKNFKYPQRVKA